MSSGNRPLPKLPGPMLTQFYVAIWCHWAANSWWTMQERFASLASKPVAHLTENIYREKFSWTKTFITVTALQPSQYVNMTLKHHLDSRPNQSGQPFADDILCTNCDYKGLIPVTVPALVQIMAWRRSCDKPLSEPMMYSLLTYICITRSQWVNRLG